MLHTFITTRLRTQEHHTSYMSMRTIVSFRAAQSEKYSHCSTPLGRRCSFLVRL
jgi:hypothetical protein